MKPQSIKLRLVLCGALILFAATLSTPMPILAQRGALQTAKIEPALLTALQANPRGEFAVIVQTNMPNLKDKPDVPGAPSIKDVRDAKGNYDPKKALKALNPQRARWAVDRIRAVAGKRVNQLTIIGGAAATLTADAIAKLSLDPFVSNIHLDKKMKVLGTPGEQSLYAQIVNAPSVWAEGFNGQGVAVAILDSGVAAHDDLALPASRIIASTDLVTTPAVSGDPGGHGTHVAGIVAGNGTDSAQAREGIAPGANIVNVRVIGSDGTASLSSVIGGIQWVIHNRKTYNIRVMNLSLGATAANLYRDDPLAAAVEMAWNSGIVVVAAAGNNMNVPGSIVTPGIDPFIITVGALDDAQTLATADDTVAFYSSIGPTLDGFHKPDLVAPGRKVVSLRVPSSFLDTLLPDRVTGASYFRLSGTSMSAPVVAGTTALMLQRNPGLKPNQVKYILIQTARPVALSPGVDSTGAGLVDAYAAVKSNLNGKANLGLTPSDNFAKTVYPMLRGMPLTGMWRNLTYRGVNWVDITWDDITWDRTTWENLRWEDITWDNLTWSDITWDDVTWDSVVWDVGGSTGAADYGAWLALRPLD